MAISFFARGDSASANNSEINSQGTSKTPVTKITFEAASGGDTKLEFNGGNPDPDTVMFINGVARSFTVEITGTLPSKKMTNVNGENLAGENVMVVTDNATGQRYYFLTDRTVSAQTMDAMPNGAIPIENVHTAQNPPPVCFARGTLIDTPNGPCPIEELSAGDAVDSDIGPAPVRWIGSSAISPRDLVLDPRMRPIRFRAGSLGPGLPTRDLTVSPNHRMQVSGWKLEMQLGLDRALCAAKYLVDGRGVEIYLPPGGIEYFHIMFDAHRLVRAHGVTSESLYLGRQALRHISPAARSELVRLFPRLAESREIDAPTALPVLRRHEAVASA